MLLRAFFLVFANVITVLVLATALTLCDSDEFEGLVENEDTEAHERFTNRLWFAITTLSTVGYGDVYPVSKRARTITAVAMLTLLSGLPNALVA